VANAISVKILLAIMVLLKLQARQVDVATAFLNAVLVEHEEVYVRLTSRVSLPRGYVKKLIKALYSLVQAP
jgi:hypothetical protein